MMRVKLYDAYENGVRVMTGTVDEIAGRYFLSPRTVGNYRYVGTWLKLRPHGGSEPEFKSCRTCAHMHREWGDYCDEKGRSFGRGGYYRRRDCGSYEWDGVDASRARREAGC